MKWKTHGLVVSTSTACFLCYQEIGIVSSDGPFSLRNMCHHLKINLKETIAVPEKLLPILEKMDVQVSLCGGCGSETEKFSAIYREMEGVRLRLASSLETIHRRLEGAMNSSELVEQFQKKLEGDPQALLHSVIVEKLRTEVAQKCHLSIRKTQPRVKIWRLVKNQQKSKEPDSVPIVTGRQFKLDPDDGTTLEDEMIAGHSALPSMSNMNLRTPSTTLPFKSTVSDVKPTPTTSKPDEEGHNNRLGVSHPHIVALLGGSSSSQTTMTSTEGSTASTRKPFSCPFSCQFCIKSFYSKIGLITHVTKMHNIATKVRKFKCDLCPKSFTTNNNLKYHLLSGHFKRRLPCQYCHKTFPHSTISQHQKFHCPGLYPELKRMVSPKDTVPNLASVESGEARIENSIDLSNVNNMDLTPTQHGTFGIMDTRPFAMNLAGPISNPTLYSVDPQSVQHSSNYNLNEPTGAFNCEMCIQHFDNLQDKRRHIRKQHQAERLICPHCKKSFANQNSRDRHIQEGYCTFLRSPQNEEGNDNHARTTTLTRIKNIIERRQAKQVVDSEMSYSCQICGSSFTSKIGLGTHFAKVHVNPTKVPRFACDLCGKTFFKLVKLKQHRKSIHFGSQFRCQRCGKSYGLESSLYAHQKSCCNAVPVPSNMKRVSDIIAAHRQSASSVTEGEGNKGIDIMGDNSEGVTNDYPGTVSVNGSGVVHITSGDDLNLEQHDNALSDNCEQLMPGLNYYQFRTEEERLEHLQPDPLDDLA